MNKKSTIIISILSVIIICLIGALFYLNNYYIKQIDYIFKTSKEKEYTCTFTKTYMVSNIWTVDTKEEIPGMSYIIVKQFQIDDVITLIIPTELKDKLETGKYYEFTYTFTGKKQNIKTMEDINNYLQLANNNEEFRINIDAKETDKQGLEQIQEDICLPYN